MMFVHTDNIRFLHAKFRSELQLRHIVISMFMNKNEQTLATIHFEVVDTPRHIVIQIDLRLLAFRNGRIVTSQTDFIFGKTAGRAGVGANSGVKSCTRNVLWACVYMFVFVMLAL